MRERWRSTRAAWTRGGLGVRALILVFGAFELPFYSGITLFCAGVALVAVTGGAHFSLVILGEGVLLFFVGALPRGF